MSCTRVACFPPNLPKDYLYKRGLKKDRTNIKRNSQLKHLKSRTETTSQLYKPFPLCVNCNENISHLHSRDEDSLCAQVVSHVEKLTVYRGEAPQLPILLQVMEGVRLQLVYSSSGLFVNLKHGESKIYLASLGSKSIQPSARVT